MRLVIQRVSEASATIGHSVKGAIGQGLLVLIGIGSGDTMEDVDWLVQKTLHMRIFSDADDKMNLSLLDIGGGLLLISQFTLHASTKKGNRPSFIAAARPEQAIPLYNYAIKAFSGGLGKAIQTGEFGADMKVALINDGPVTIVVDSRQKE